MTHRLAAALRAQASALAALADTLEAQPVAAPPAATLEQWVPLRQCGLPLATVRRLVRGGVLEGRRVGREVRVRAVDVAEWLDGQRVQPRAVDVEQALGDAVSSGDIDQMIEAALSKGRLRVVAGARRK